jgi:hypothetical protein
MEAEEMREKRAPQAEISDGQIGRLASPDRRLIVFRGQQRRAAYLTE